NPRSVQELTREDIELLLPGPERVGARTILRTVTRLLAARLPPSGSAAADPNPPRSGFGTVCHFDLPAALCARHLEGLDGRVIPSSSLLDTVTSNGSAEHLVATIATLELNLSVLGDTTPSHSPEVTPQSLLAASRASTSLAGKPNFRPSAFVPSLVRWCILALLTTNLPLAAVLGHLVWCSKYVELHGPYTAALYDQLHRSAVAASLRAGSSVTGAELGTCDSMLVIDCRSQMDRALRARGPPSSSGPSRQQQGFRPRRAAPYPSPPSVPSSSPPAPKPSPSGPASSRSSASGHPK
ncbi:hypothetical protein Pmar_PMAR027350, partial [Perkinsus marinus ATCC 50983]